MASKGVAVGLLEYSRQRGRIRSPLTNGAGHRIQKSKAVDVPTPLSHEWPLRKPKSGSTSPSDTASISPRNNRSVPLRNGSVEVLPEQSGYHPANQAPTIFLSLNETSQTSPPVSPRRGNRQSPRHEGNLIVAPPVHAKSSSGFDGNVSSGVPKDPFCMRKVHPSLPHHEINTVIVEPPIASEASVPSKEQTRQTSATSDQTSNKANPIWSAFCGSSRHPIDANSKDKAAYEYFHGLLEWERKQRRKTELKLQEKRSALWNAQQEAHEKILAHEEERVRLKQALEMKNRVLEFERTLLQTKYDQDRSNAEKEKDKLKHQLGQHALCLRSLLKEVSALQLEREALQQQVSNRDGSPQYATSESSDGGSCDESAPEFQYASAPSHSIHSRSSQGRRRPCQNSHGRWAKQEHRVDNRRCRIPTDSGRVEAHRQSPREASPRPTHSSFLREHSPSGRTPVSSDARELEKSGSCNGSQGAAYFKHMEAYARRLRKERLSKSNLDEIPRSFSEQGLIKRAASKP